MNLALPALVVFVLLLPGFLARSRFKRIERSSLDFSPFGQVATEAVMWACGFHLVWTGLSTWFTGRSAEPDVVLRLLSSEPRHQADAIALVAMEFRHIVVYFLTLFTGAYFFPTFARQAVTHFRLDCTAHRCSPIFRFHQALWYYLLSGADFAKGAEPDFIAVSAIVDVAGKAFLFTGIGMCQGSCRLHRYAMRVISVVSTRFRSGFRYTTSFNVQFRTPADQRCGWR